MEKIIVRTPTSITGNSVIVDTWKQEVRPGVHAESTYPTLLTAVATSTRDLNG